MTARRLTTAATLLVLLVVLGVMAVYGFKAATAPLPGGRSGAAKQDCTAAEKNVKTSISRAEVQVSVFNASGRSGLAGKTLESVERAGFKAGNAGNAPRNAQVRVAEVWTTEQDDPAARLVALAFGRRTKVVVTDTDLGPGIDVLVGNRFQSLNRKAPKKLKLPAPVETCVEVN
jgi:hypothetical protein